MLRSVLALVAAVVAVAVVHGADLPLPACPLRTLTGIPCPACGSTTAALAVSRLDLGTAALTAPATLLGALLVVTRDRWLDRWRTWTPAVRRSLLLAALAAAQTWQLVRI